MTSTNTTVASVARKTTVASAIFSGLRYASLVALSGVFLVASATGQLKHVAAQIVSPHKFWMPVTSKLAQAFSIICLAFGATSVAEMFAKVAKNYTAKSASQDSNTTDRTKTEKALLAGKTVFNVGLAVMASAAAYYSFKFMALFAKAVIAAKNSNFMSALKNTGQALNMSSLFSKLFAFVGIAHAAKGLFKTSATMFKYIWRRNQDNRPSGRKVAKQSVKTSLKITAAVGGVLCATLPVIGWALMGGASLVLMAWSISKIWRRKNSTPQSEINPETNSVNNSPAEKAPVEHSVPDANVVVVGQPNTNSVNNNPTENAPVENPVTDDNVVVGQLVRNSSESSVVSLEAQTVCWDACTQEAAANAPVVTTHGNVSSVSA